VLRRVKEAAYTWAISRAVLRGGFRDLYDRHLFFYQAFRLLSTNGITGDYAEFGSFRGLTFWQAYTEIARQRLPARLWAFDSFEGLPRPRSKRDEHPTWRPGSMATSESEFHAVCRRRGISRERYEAVKGLFSDTLPGRAAPRDIALAYIDSDMYSSAVDVLNFLEPRLKQGMIIAFDDYFCMSSTQAAGERLALQEFTARNDRFEFVPYLPYSFGAMSFVLEAKRGG